MSVFEVGPVTPDYKKYNRDVAVRLGEDCPGKVLLTNPRTGSLIGKLTELKIRKVPAADELPQVPQPGSSNVETTVSAITPAT